MRNCRHSGFTSVLLLLAALSLCRAAAGNDAQAAATPAEAEAIYEQLVARFDAERAFGDLEAQVALGARHPGSAGSLAMRAWLAERLDEIGLDHWEQPFTARSVLAGEDLPGANVVAALPGIGPDGERDAASTWVALTCHWDSRLYADRDPDDLRRREHVPAANDGASGVAVLLELARALREGRGGPGPRSGSSVAHPPVLFVFYDFEDQGGRDADDFALGSAFFADNLPTTTTLRGAINFDMVGDRQQEFLLERHSLDYAPAWTEAYWSHGMRRFPDRFSRRRQSHVADDHLALNRRGIPAVDLIDFDYAPWHTTGDLPEACSAESLKVVGMVTLSFLAYDAQPLSP